MDELDFKGGLVGEFKRTGSKQRLLNAGGNNEEAEAKPFISKSPSNSSFGFENTFRVLESQVSQTSTVSGYGTGTDEEGLQMANRQPVIVTTLELELDAMTRLQQFNGSSTPKDKQPMMGQLRRGPDLGTSSDGESNPDSDKYLDFLNQFIRKSRQRKQQSPGGSGCDKTEESDCCDKNAAAIGVDLEEGLVEFGEYPELVYCMKRDRAGRYRLQNKDRIKSPARKSNEGNFMDIF